MKNTFQQAIHVIQRKITNKKANYSFGVQQGKGYAESKE
jgi:hypothetical protein